MAIIQIDETELEKIVAQEVARQLQEHLEELKKYQNFNPPKEWLPDFFERTAGSLAETPLEHPPQAVFLPESTTV